MAHSATVSRTVPPSLRIFSRVLTKLPVGRVFLIHRLWRLWKSPFLAKASPLVGRFTFVCDLKDPNARTVCLSGRMEPTVSALVQSQVSPDDVFVDIGASWGYYSLLAAWASSARATIVAVEPDPRLFTLLEQNVALNKLTIVRAVQCAASSSEGELDLLSAETNRTGWGIPRMGQDPPGRVRRIKVPARRIDDVLDELQVSTVGLLKMNIEGAEDLALKGMRQGLSEHRYLRLFIELHPPWLLEHGSSTSEVLHFLQTFGYTLYWLEQARASRRVAYAARLPDVMRMLKPVADREGPPEPWPSLVALAPNVKLRGSNPEAQEADAK